jgi:tetratricopeptide (TPR) repeat protein
LETIRQYAQEHLDKSGAADDLRAAHANYYADFAEIAIPGVAGPDGIDWEHRFEREIDNVRLALAWASETEDADTALRLLGVWADSPYVQVGDAVHGTLGTWAFDAVFALPGAAEHPKYPAALVICAGSAWGRGDQELARRRCDEALAAEQRLGTYPSFGLWFVRSNIALAQGRLADALDDAGHGVALARARAEPAQLAVALSLSALVYALSGDPAAALPDAEEVVVLTHRLVNPHVAQNALALAAFALGDSEPERAIALAREAIDLAGPSEHSTSWSIAADLAARHGDRRDALTYAAKAIETLQWLGNRTALGNVIGRTVAPLLVDDDLEATAILQGAGDALAPGYAHAPHTLEAEQRASATLDATLGAARRHELYARGMAMTDTEAVAYANSAIARSLDQDAT